MATIIQRIKDLNLPLDDVVVLGSGLLDALGLREAHDIDFAVSADLYERLREEGVYTPDTRYGLEMLSGDDIEIWQDWREDWPFQKLKDSAVIVDGIAFANPSIIIERKRERDLPKDREDIRLLEEYIRNNG